MGSINPPTGSFIIGGAIASGVDRYLSSGNKIRAVVYYDYDTQLLNEHADIVSYLGGL